MLERLAGQELLYSSAKGGNPGPRERGGAGLRSHSEVISTQSPLLLLSISCVSGAQQEGCHIPQRGYMGIWVYGYMASWGGLSSGHGPGTLGPHLPWPSLISDLT